MASQNHQTNNSRRRSRRAGADYDWAEASTEELLDIRICDLGLKLDGSMLESRIDELYAELDERGIRFRPHFWLAEEWFSPDGVPGIAIPFYLAHPRLMRLERQQMLEVEGGAHDWCLKILRHETGHTIDTAYRLHRRRSYREIFGRHTLPYPEYYQPRPFSRKYVLHLDLWYAQSHPVEDFAETFAVWLRPNSRWKSRYRGWPALRKIEYVDELMQEIGGEAPPVRSQEHVDPVRTIRTTLREHYARKRTHYGLEDAHVYDHDLRRLFSDAPEHADRRSASAFLRGYRRELRKVVSQWTGEYQYTIDQVLVEMIERCRELKLRLRRSERDTKRDALVMLTVQTMHYLHGGHHRLAL